MACASDATSLREQDMPLYKRTDSQYWQIEFEISGIRVRRSAETRNRKAAQELEQSLRADVWRQIKLGERRYTWADAIGKCRLEDSAQRSWERTERCLKVIGEYIPPDKDLREITYDSLLTLRELLLLRQSKGHGWIKTVRPWKPSTVNRHLSVIGSILERCASDRWGYMLEHAPELPLLKLEPAERRWLTRAQAHALLGRFPLHTREMMVFALATGLRKSNVAGLTWDRIDMSRQCCHIPGHLSKTGKPIAVPLNEDAIAVLKLWQPIHAERTNWSGEAHRFVFVYRGHAPIKQLTTAMWRRECKAAGLEGVTFHTMRHPWASWQVQTGTPMRMLQELGGWASLQMPALYSHIDPGHLAEYAERSLLGESPTDSTTVDTRGDIDDLQAIDFGGKGGNRTLDPGIMIINSITCDGVSVVSGTTKHD
jgi:integrase